LSFVWKEVCLEKETFHFPAHEIRLLFPEGIFFCQQVLFCPHFSFPPFITVSAAPIHPYLLGSAPSKRKQTCTNKPGITLFHTWAAAKEL